MQNESDRRDWISRKDAITLIVCLCAVIGGFATSVDRTPGPIAIMDIIACLGYAFMFYIATCFLSFVCSAIWTDDSQLGKCVKYALSVLLIAVAAVFGFVYASELRQEPDAAEPNNYCYECDGPADEWNINTIRGDLICSTCFSEGVSSGEYAMCKICGKFCQQDDHYDGCCISCYESGYGFCSCGEFISIDDVVYLDDGTQMCWKCVGYTEDVMQCMDCGVYYFCHYDPDTSTKEYCNACVEKNTVMCDICEASGLPIRDLTGYQAVNIMDDYWMCAQCLTTYMEEYGDYDLQRYVVENSYS